MEKNQNQLETFRLRHLLKRFTQKFFDDRGFIEIDTPILVPLPGAEVHLDYFATEWRDYSGSAHPVFLRSSPELHLKQAVAAGMKQPYTLGPCFRNGGEIGRHHCPEFTMLEWYDAGRDLNELCRFTLDYLETSYDFIRSLGVEPPQIFSEVAIKMTVAEAFKKFSGIELIDNDAGLAAKAKAANVASIMGGEDFETAFFKVFIEKVEPELAKIPVCILSDYPGSQSVLAEMVGGWSRRFEVYLYGVELCNAFQELSSAESNKEKLEEISQKRLALNKIDHPKIDEDYLEATKNGLPKCSGNALGFDRWLFFLLGFDNIGDAIPFAKRQPFKDY